VANYRDGRNSLGGEQSRCYDRGMFIRCGLVSVLVTALTGCASTPPRVVRSEFEDIVMPRGLTYQPGDSVVIESPTVKAARLVYRGRIESQSLGVALRTLLESNGWRRINVTTNPEHGTTQTYDKDENALQVLIWEGLWYTYVELTASRVVLSPSTSVSKAR